MAAVCGKTPRLMTTPGRGAGAGGHPHQMSKHCQAAKEAACQWRSAIGNVGAMVG